MTTNWKWHWNMTKNWAAPSAEIKWEEVYQNFKARMEKEELECKKEKEGD